MNDDNVLRVGDRMLWSLDFIESIKDKPMQRTELLEVDKIETDAVGVKIVRMRRVLPDGDNS
jgi:hypothetical protein